MDRMSRACLLVTLVTLRRTFDVKTSNVGGEEWS